ncbi:hypothetical protein Skr01_40230 [Sphaerisporangium krabiense]|uniref:Uncharacterized protein n=1 Tax=Sphaerisporangium krabiense TaxID=763782 RepID=A0A7W8Z9F4_9ACTN|nr:hypothetical protein [Sphaerisporangium krabiense]MBB5629838.1 hypothetical protein [Sphaerisporangium krabiense]GII63938.1 hypothetical protein Skr01_40230 [Sphaerisporangium krabiense]
MLVVLTMRRARPSCSSTVEGIRILALLPRQWRKDLTQAVGYIAIRIQTDEEVTAAQIRAQVAAILANPEIGHWELLTCETLAHHDGESRPAAAARRAHQHAAWN